MKDFIKIYKDDVIRAIYFICRLTQNQNGKAMSGALSSKKDFIGGIFDRWINIIPESFVFNKAILPSISCGKNVQVITDYYSYDPSSDKAGIAPDVIGLRVEGKVIPFVVFDEKWVPVKGMPQIEMKTFKKADYMVSLRNQGYDEKYLCMVESDFRIDYLIPFFDKSIFSENIYKELQMDDSSFIVSNKNGFLSEMNPVDISSDEIGSVKLSAITRADSFMKMSTCCESGVSVEFLKNIEECSAPTKLDKKEFTSICDQFVGNIYRFNSNWYSGIGEDSIPFRETKKKNGQISRLKVRTLDFYASNINSLRLLKCNKQNFIVVAIEDCLFNNNSFKKGKCYKISYSCLERGNGNDEYFMQKDLVPYVDSYADELQNKLKEIIKNC